MLKLDINGKVHEVDAEPDTPLLWVIREWVGLTGTKYGCGIAECGACSVHIDGAVVRSCSIAAGSVIDAKITTIEGLTQGDALTPVMQAFVDHDAQQCGFCTPGFLVATTHFLESHPNPTKEDIRRGLSGNYCRCGTYNGIRAVALATKPQGSAS